MHAGNNNSCSGKQSSGELQWSAYCCCCALSCTALNLQRVYKLVQLLFCHAYPAANARVHAPCLTPVLCPLLLLLLLLLLVLLLLLLNHAAGGWMHPGPHAAMMNLHIAAPHHTSTAACLTSHSSNSHSSRAGGDAVHGGGCLPLLNDMPSTHPITQR
jgi:hypothetical protein